MSQLIEFTNNHPLLVTGTLLMGLAVIFYELRLRTRRVFEVAPPQAVRLINQGARVVDLRDRPQYDAGHIVDALNIPAGQLPDHKDRRLKKNKPVILVCETGANSARCVEPMRKAGYEQTFSLAGGLTAWRRDNLPLSAS